MAGFFFLIHKIANMVKTYFFMFCPIRKKSIIARSGVDDTDFPVSWDFTRRTCFFPVAWLRRAAIPMLLPASKFFWHTKQCPLCFEPSDACADYIFNLWCQPRAEFSHFQPRRLKSALSHTGKLHKIIDFWIALCRPVSSDLKGRTQGKREFERGDHFHSGIVCLLAVQRKSMWKLSLIC